MAVVERAADASLDASTGAFADQLSGNLHAGEDLPNVSPCRIGTDGLVYRSDGTADDADASFDGFTARAVKAGQPVTLYGAGARFRYAESGLAPGTLLYIAATAGELDDSPTTGDPDGVAKVVNATDIRVIRNA